MVLKMGEGLKSSILRERGMQSRSVLKWMIGSLAVAISLFHLYTGAFGVFESMLQRSVHLLSLLALCFLTVPFSKRLPKRISDGIDIPLALLAIAIDAYMVLEHPRIVSREWYYGPMTTLDIVFGTLTILLILEAARRLTGWALPAIATIFLGYALFGNYFPAPFTIRRTDPLTLIDHMFLTPQAIFGIPTGVSATFVFLFILFGSFLEKTGGGRFFIDLSLSLVGRVIGGPAKVAVISSSLFGTISGSSVANVYGTGTFTIPLMKRFGYTPNFAGAVEAAASTGGQIMPPVMGAAAFVMAEFLGVSYAKIMIMAIIPALLYYLSVYSGVHNEAVKRGLRGLPKEDVPAFWPVLKRGYHFSIPPVVLVYLLVSGYTAFRAAFVGTLVLIGVSILRRETRLDLKGLWGALEGGAKNAIMVATACAAAGIVVGVLDLTGLGIKFVSVVLFLSGNNFLLTLLFTMIACLVLGMGMPTTPAYIIAALVGAPVLVQLGANPFAAHMFVFYGALLSAITPPVALAAYAGAAIAEGEPMRTGWIACRLGFVKFIVPFLFVYNPVLLIIGPWYSVLEGFITASVGVLALSFALDGWLWGKLNIPARIIFASSGLFLMIPEWKTDLIGIALFVLVFVPCIGRIKGIRAPSLLSWKKGPFISQISIPEETDPEKGGKGG